MPRTDLDAGSSSDAAPSPDAGRSADASRSVDRVRRDDAPWSHVSPPLLLAVLVVMAGDVVTTGVGLHLGLDEGNPVVATLLAHLGIAGLVLVKAVTAGLLVVLPTLTRRSRRTFRLGSFVYLIVGTLVVISNLLAIASVAA
ncbi:DUF5658 family protein [Halomicrococcus sp. NG-SE-24]|uniref:DUF5658 family protein n=1 Tax=Halomicrococcus sp. NG-SE-24 TaxID=3436928 RepID=UPI003D98E862